MMCYQCQMLSSASECLYFISSRSCQRGRVMEWLWNQTDRISKYNLSHLGVFSFFFNLVFLLDFSKFFQPYNKGRNNTSFSLFVCFHFIILYNVIHWPLKANILLTGNECLWEIVNSKVKRYSDAERRSGWNIIL